MKWVDVSLNHWICFKSTHFQIQLQKKIPFIRYGQFFFSKLFIKSVQFTQRNRFHFLNNFLQFATTTHFLILENKRQSCAMEQSRFWTRGAIVQAPSHPSGKTFFRIKNSSNLLAFWARIRLEWTFEIRKTAILVFQSKSTFSFSITIHLQRPNFFLFKLVFSLENVTFDFVCRF